MRRLAESISILVLAAACVRPTVAPPPACEITVTRARVERLAGQHVRSTATHKLRSRCFTSGTPNEETSADLVNTPLGRAITSGDETRILLRRRRDLPAHRRVDRGASRFERVQRISRRRQQKRTFLPPETFACVRRSCCSCSTPRSRRYRIHQAARRAARSVTTGEPRRC